MADLNALIAQGAQFDLPNPVDQYSKMLQLQQMGQTNQLNKLKMDEYARGVDEQNKLRQVMATPGFDVSNPSHQAALLQAAPSTAPALLEKLAQVKKEQAQTGLYGSQSGQIDYEVQAKKLAQGLIEISNMSDAASAKASIDAHIADKSITPEKGAQLKASIDATPDFLKWKTQTLTGMLAAKDRLEAMDEEARIASRTPAAAPAAPAAPQMYVTKDSKGNPRYIVNEVEVTPEEYQSAQANVQVQPVRLGAQNAMAPTSVNALTGNAATMQAMDAERKRLANERNRLLGLKQSKGVQEELKGVEAQIKELNTPINLRESGTAITPFGAVTAAAAPTELTRLQQEKAAAVAKGDASAAAQIDAKIAAMTQLSDHRTEIEKMLAITADPQASQTAKDAATARIAAMTHIPEKAMSDFEKGLAASNLPETEKQKLRVQWLKTHSEHAPAINIQTNVNAYTPASEEAQRDFIKSTRATYDTLKNAPATLKNIEEAIKLIPNAKGFMGPGGESLLDAASFLNSRLGTSINTKGISDATELRSRLFQGIIENLRKLDANPTENQQNAMRVALGNIGTDPNALPAVLNSFADTVRAKVDAHNTEVNGAVARGVKFPYDPTIKLPTFTPPAPSGAALIPTGKPAAAGEWKVVK